MSTLDFPAASEHHLARRARFSGGFARNPARLRMFTLTGLMTGLVATIIWCAVASWAGIQEIRSHFTQVQARASSLRVRESVVDLTGILAEYELSRSPEDWGRFQDVNVQLATRLRKEKTEALTSGEREAYANVERAYAEYLNEAKAIGDSVDDTRAGLAKRFTRIQRAARELMAATSATGAVRRQANAEFIRESEKSLVWLQQVISTALVLLLVLAGWAVHMLYRDTIAPLRLKLLETRELAQRQEKLASLGTLASGVAHEIRNPLTAIKARLFTLKKALPPQGPAERDAVFIGESIGRLERIVGDFLAFARPREPRLELVAPGDLFQRVHELLGPEIALAAVELEIGDCTGEKLLGDTQQLEQVLINLVRNAAESIGRAGRITLTARATQLALSETTRYVVMLEVHDTGAGIPAEVQERLFDPFFSTKPSGTGLGLSIAARIVEQHGGALQYQTEVNRGTLFAVILPATDRS